MTKRKTGRKRARAAQGKPPVEHQFAPGNPGGPGRPRGSIIARLRELAENDPDVLARLIYRKARAGNFKFVAMVLNRLYGKEPIRIAGADGGPVKLIAVTTPDAI